MMKLGKTYWVGEALLKTGGGLLLDGLGYVGATGGVGSSLTSVVLHVDGAGGKCASRVGNFAEDVD
jgi:hypothetical protein